MQLALAEGALHKAQAQRQRGMEIASLLEEKRAVPAVMEQLAYLASVQEPEFWVGITLQGLEELRLRVRGLVHVLDKQKRKNEKIKEKYSGGIHGGIIISTKSICVICIGNIFISTIFNVFTPNLSPSNKTIQFCFSKDDNPFILDNQVNPSMELTLILFAN